MARGLKPALQSSAKAVDPLGQAQWRRGFALHSIKVLRECEFGKSTIEFTFHNGIISARIIPSGRSI